MKILQLRFQNLNSLAGEWLIDFTDPAFAAEGIFAITGPTGAGKSSILDAICLALYGRTPRLGKITKSSNEIMSRQTGECFAEVTFATQSGQYRCHWSQHRSRRKADGELQQPKQEIANALNGEVLESKLREVEEAVISITGMDFERFTRSVLLAQGGFAAFLQAAPDARAPILEQITGTEIYSHISMRVHAMQREQRDQLVMLQAQHEGFRLLTAEEEQALNEQLTQASVQKQQLADVVGQLAEVIQWQQTLAQLRGQIAGLQEGQQQLDAQRQAFVPERERLALAQQAAELEPALTELQGLRNQLVASEQQLATEQEGLPQLLATLEAGRAGQQQSVQAVNDARAALAAAAPVLREVRVLDLQLQQGRQSLADSGQNLDKANSELAQTKSSQLQYQQQLQQGEQQAVELEEYFRQHAADEWLVSGLAGIEQQLQQLQHHHQRLQLQEQARQQTEHRLAETRQQLEQQRTHWTQARDSLQQGQDELVSQQARLTELLAGRLLPEYRREREHLLDKRTLLARIQSLEEQRQQLHDGQPCPLCGSESHPYADGQIPQPDQLSEQIQALEQLIERIEQQQDSCRQQEQAVQLLQTAFAEAKTVGLGLSTRLEGLQDNLDEQCKAVVHLEQQLVEYQQQTNAALVPLGMQLTELHETAGLLQQLQQRQVRWQQQLGLQQQLQQDRQQHVAEITRLQSLLELYENTVHSLQQEQQGLRSRQEELGQRRAQLLGQDDADQYEQQLQQTLVVAESRQQQLAEQAKAAEQEHTRLQERIAVLEQQITDCRARLDSHEAGFVELLATQQFADEAALRAALLPADVRQQLQQQAQQLDQQQATLLARLQEQQEHLQREQQRNLTSEPAEAVQAAYDQRSSELQALHDQLVTLTLRQQDNARARDEQAEAGQALERQKEECRRWNNLHELIGSADGKKFRNFAQGLTFELMVAHANRTLQQMTDRYLLVRDVNEPLELNVLDNYQAGEVRSTKNLSGGESFIVSLALALGLSRMASQNVRVDSLFLDEGFGTLDEEALDVALTTLSGLQEDGKLIGVISHVQALKERIATRIQVRPLSGGRSRLEGPGCGQS